VVIGVLTHDASAAAFTRDLLCFLGSWFVVALAVRLYAGNGRRRLAITWLAGVSLAVLVRAAIVGHIAFDFWGIALAFTALFVLAARLLLRNGRLG
jgi:Protein of unknown function (DUF3054)